MTDLFYMDPPIITKCFEVVFFRPKREAIHLDGFNPGSMALNNLQSWFQYRSVDAGNDPSNTCKLVITSMKCFQVFKLLALFGAKTKSCKTVKLHKVTVKWPAQRFEPVTL